MSQHTLCFLMHVVSLETLTKPDVQALQGSSAHIQMPLTQLSILQHLQGV